MVLMANITPRIVVALIIIGIIFFYPGSKFSPKDTPSNVKDIIAYEQAALRCLNIYGADDFVPLDTDNPKWLNLTGLREEDGYAWPLLAQAKKTARDDFERIAGSRGVDLLDGSTNSTLLLYQNVTGWIRGQWSRLEPPDGFQAPRVNLSVTAPNITYGEDWDRNITGHGGKLRLMLQEKDVIEHSGDTMAYVSALLSIQDDSSRGDGWEMTVHGVHHKASGNIVLSTTSEKFAGVFALPHFTLSPSWFNMTKVLLNRTLTRDISRQVADGADASLNPWRSKYTAEDDEYQTPACEIVVYLQQYPSQPLRNRHKLLKDESDSLSFVESELRAPSGVYLGYVPPLSMSMVAFSPDCGFIVESKKSLNDASQDARRLNGLKYETYVDMTNRILCVFIIVLVLQVMLLVRELKAVSTPSMQTRLSFYTVAMLTLGDAFTWVFFLTTAFFSESFYLAMLTVAFFAFLEGSFFGMKFLLEIWSVQAVERAARHAEGQLPAGTTNIPISTTSATSINAPDTLPLPVTAPRPGNTGLPAVELPLDTPTTAPIVAPANAPPENSPRNFGLLYTKYYLFLLAVVFLSINAATSWPVWLRSLYANMMSLVYLSFWVPQIYRNVIRNSRQSFSWQYVAGQSILRLVPFGYLWGIEDNALSVDTDRNMLVVLTGWTLLQMLALICQGVFGPRFFVKDTWKWVPVAWDYHPVLHEDDEGATMPLGFMPGSPTLERVDSSSEVVEERQRLHDGGIREFECAICMQNAKVAVSAHEGEHRGEVLGRRKYMVTPCRHIFHTGCLESWMKFRLACPICRSHLPQ